MRKTLVPQLLAGMALALAVAAGLSAQDGKAAPEAKAADWYHGGPWEKGLFGPDLAAIRQAADASRYRSPEPTTVLMHEGRAVFGADGSLEEHLLLVYRVENDDGVKNWSDIELGYSPWHQDPPKLRVRILNPDGKTYEITEKDLIASSSGSDEDRMYSDRKNFKAPYPNVTVGSLIEEEITTFSRPYLKGSGMEGQMYFGRRNAVGLYRYTVSHPATMKLQCRQYGLDGLAPVRTEAGGTVTLVWEKRQAEPLPEREDSTPPELRQRPTIAVGSAPDWAAIAGAYGAEIDKVIAQDKFDAPAELKLPKGDAKAAVLAASAWINAKVRYTGMELGQNSIVPFPPSKVVARGYGDCKDKATMLVALLRKAGYKAWVSLLQTGPGWDIDPALSGMTSFNHAIAYVDEAGGFWFDPTVEINRSAALPYHDQYRYTLVARPGQKAPLRTPQDGADANQVRETRDIYLADEGKASVVETTEYFGAFDSYYRNMAPYQDPKKVKESLEGYVDSYYGSKKMTAYGWSDPRDLSKPISLNVSAKEVNRGLTDDATAEVTIHLNNLRSNVPDILLNEKDPKRTQPFRFNLPFSYKLVSTFHPPAGFQVRDLPPAVDVKNPAFAFTRTWETLKDGSVRGVAYFAVTKLELSPLELTTLRADLKKLLEAQNQLTVNFDHQAEALRAEGRYGEAFDRYRTLLKANPDSAVQNKRLSAALLSYSLGQPAAHYARRAVELDPQKASLWANLANTLQHDGLGRRLNKGFDRAGAIEAWKKARELDPEDKSYTANLAVLYEYNADGEHYQDPAALALARTEYRSLGKALQEYNLSLNLWNVEIRLGNFADAKALIDDIKDEGVRNVAKVITGVMSGDKTPPLKLLEPNLSLDKRQQYLAGAAGDLVNLRRYQDAAALLRLAAVANKNAGELENRADMLARVKSVDKDTADRSTPEGALRSFFFDYLNQGLRGSGLYGKHFTAGFGARLPQWGEKRVQKQLDQFIAPVVGGAPAHLASDVTLSLLNYEASPDGDRGCKVAASFEGSGDESMVFQLAKEGGEYRIVGWNQFYPATAQYMLDLVDAGKAETAAKWFDWFFAPGKDPSGPAISLSVLKDERLPRNAWVLRGVCGVLALDLRVKDAARADLAAVWKRLGDRDAFLKAAAAAGVPDDLRAPLWTSLAFQVADIANRNQAYDLAEAAANALAGQVGDDERFIVWRSFALARWGKEAAAEAGLESLQAKKPDDRDLVSELLSLYSINLDFAKIDQLAAKYPTRFNYNDLNTLAWTELFRNPRGALSNQAVEWARKSANLSKNQNRAILHTLATVYATTGRFDEARSMIAKVIELNPGNEPTSDDWYVIGLIADGYGFHDAAVEAYQRVAHDDDDMARRTETVNLAKFRLKQ